MHVWTMIICTNYADTLSFPNQAGKSFTNDISKASLVKLIQLKQCFGGSDETWLATAVGLFNQNIWPLKNFTTVTASDWIPPTNPKAPSVMYISILWTVESEGSRPIQSVWIKRQMSCWSWQEVIKESGCIQARQHLYHAQKADVAAHTLQIYLSFFNIRC